MNECQCIKWFKNQSNSINSIKFNLIFNLNKKCNKLIDKIIVKK